VCNQDRRVFDLTGTTIDCRHPEADTLTPLETICENAVVRIVGTVEKRDIAPNDELA
jgi:hypothetical protein